MAFTFPGGSGKRWSSAARGGLALTSLFLLLSLFFSAGFASSAHATSVKRTSAATQQYDEFWAQQTAGDFGAWSLNGVSVQAGTNSAQVQLAAGSNLTCSSTDIDGGAASFNASSGLCTGTDPMAAGSYNSGNYYNGGSFSYGTLTSPIHTTKQAFTTLVASWNATTPTGTWLEVHVRVLEGKGWTHWYDLPIWASDLSTINRHSVDKQSDQGGSIATDTFLTKKSPATAYQLALTLFTTSPSVSLTLDRVGVIASYDSTSYPTIAPDTSVWGTNLNVPQRSQMLPQYQGLGYGGGGEVWCSPTSTSMIMAYWSNVLNQANLNQTVPDAAKGTYDFTYQGTGNWPFNTGYAASFGGIHSYVTRMYSMSQVEQWIKAGVPIAISIAFSNGQLPGAPITSSTGHLIVVRGFDASGNVIVNDPAFSTDATVETTYNRADLQNVWLSASNGTAYVIYPEGWSVPTM